LSTPATNTLFGGTLLRVSIDGIIGTLVGPLTYDAPVVSFQSGRNGPTSGGVDVTISGLGFGQVSLSPTASVGVNANPNGVGGNGRCTSNAWISTTSVYCRVPPGTGYYSTSPTAIDAGNIFAVTVGGVVGTLTQRWSYDAPVVSGSAPLNLGSTLGPSLTISGVNFGSAAVTQTATILGTVCATTSWVSFTALTCDARTGTYVRVSSAAAVAVTVSSTLGSAMPAAAFSFNAPVVSGLLVPNAAVSGSTLTLAGLDFGFLDVTATVAVDGYYGSARMLSFSCQTTAWTTATTVSCARMEKVWDAAVFSPIPAFNGGANNVAVTVNAIVGTAVRLLTFDAPVSSDGSSATPAASAPRCLGAA